MTNDQNLPTDDAYYEAIASEEEVYLEETEEELRSILPPAVHLNTMQQLNVGGGNASN